MQMVRKELLDTLVFFELLQYPPTKIELLRQCWMREEIVGDMRFTLEDVPGCLDELLRERIVCESRGRIVFFGQEKLIEQHEQNARWFPRKMRAARRVTAWLSRIQGVRFVALCNTTAFMNAKDESDLDFLVITKQGTIAQVRLWSTLPFKLLGRRPHARQEERDAVCLSFFIDETALNLQPLLLSGSDPYFEFWFLNLLPLLDDGIGTELWNANEFIWKRHPFASRWVIHSGLEQKKCLTMIPTIKLVETLFSRVQQRVFPQAMKAAMNRSTDVVVNEHVWKFHLEDGREDYRRRFNESASKIVNK